MKELLRSAYRILKSEGLISLLNEGYYYAIETLHRTIGQAINTKQGENIYSRDWDILIVLDACRYDLMCEVEDDFDFIESVGKFRSLGSHSQEWLSKNFDKEHQTDMIDTVHITGNIYSKDELESNDFLMLDEAWRDAWDDELKTTPPKPITERGIDAYRELNPQRMILHYMQPHEPFIPSKMLGSMDNEHDKNYEVENWGKREGGKPVWDKFRDGEINRSQLWSAYKDNLEHVLSSVETLLNNVDADKVVITADHGNAIGERGVYGHPESIYIDCLRDVPWVETSAENTENKKTDINKKMTNLEDEEVKDRLEKLGYR